MVIGRASHRGAGAAWCGCRPGRDRRLLRHSPHGPIPQSVVRPQRRRSAVSLAGELLRLRGVRNRQIPPFTLEGTTDYPARLDVAYPDHLNRWLVLVEWILTVPHPMVVGILIGGGSFLPPQYGWAAPWSGWDLITILAVVPAVMLLSPVTTPGACSKPADGPRPVGLPGVGVHAADDRPIPPVPAG